MNLRGELIQVGIDDEGLCRAIIKLDPADVAALEHLPMYQRVELVPVGKQRALKPEK